MADTDLCIGGDGGPLILLQASAVPQWQGVNDFENSLMNGGDVETDYDVICKSLGAKEFCVLPRHGRDMLVLWDSEFGAMLLPPQSLSLSSGTLVLTQCYSADDLSAILPKMQERLRRGDCDISLPFHAEETTLRLQVGADGPNPSYIYDYLDVPISVGLRRCDAYLIELGSYSDAVIIINESEDD